MPSLTQPHPQAAARGVAMDAAVHRTRLDLEHGVALGQRDPTPAILEAVQASGEPLQ